MQSVILVIEDHPDQRELLRTFLELDGFAVACAGSGEEALRYLDGGAPPAAVLMDLTMPGLSGCELLDGVRESRNGSAVPIFVITGRVDLPPLDGVREVLVKPCCLSSLGAKLRAAIPRTGSRSESSAQQQRTSRGSEA